MAKTTMIIDGEGVTATFSGTEINNIKKVTIPVIGEREEINLGTIDATKYDVKLLGDIQKIEDIVITKKSEPAVDLAISTDNAELVIAYKIGKATTKNLTVWAQLKNVTPAEVERQSSDSPEVDLIFTVTNLNDSLAETAPVISTPA